MLGLSDERAALVCSVVTVVEMILAGAFLWLVWHLRATGYRGQLRIWPPLHS